MAALKLEFTDATDLQVLGTKIRNVLKEVVTEISIIIQREVKEVLEETDTVASGALVDAIHRRVRALTYEYSARVFVNKRITYATKTHEGMPPGTVVAASTIKRWMLRKKSRGTSGLARSGKYMFTDLDDEDMSRVSHLIAASITKKGTSGIRFFQIAMDRVKPEIEKAIKRVVRGGA